MLRKVTLRFSNLVRMDEDLYTVFGVNSRVHLCVFECDEIKA